MIHIMNIRNRPWPKGQGHYIYVGRNWGKWKASPLANPIHFNRPCQICGQFHQDTDQGRADMAKCYLTWLRLQWKLNGPAKAELIRILKIHQKGEDITLQCFCSPKLCHANVVEQVINKLKEGY
jgi:hypothetical protein